MFGTGIVRPMTWRGTIPSALGCDDQVLGVRVEGLCDQFFADAGAIRVCGIDEINAEFHSATQDCNSGFAIFGWTPDSRARDPHCSIAKTVDRFFPAEFNRTCRCR